MLKINHTICPMCSVGCGINIISMDGFIVGINPFKNHIINEGKNCKNSVDYINRISEIKIKSFDYTKSIDEIKNKLKNVDDNKVTIITSGRCDEESLNATIVFAKENNYNLVAYEYNFQAIDDNLIATYNQIEKAKQIITIGDVYRNNSLIARRIIHAQKNDAQTINIHDEDNLTAFNSSQFIKIDSYDKIMESIEQLDIMDESVIIINTINSKENYEKIIQLVKQKNIKILPLLKYPNSHMLIRKINPSSIDEVRNAVEDSQLIICINDNPTEYLGEDILNDKQIISISEDNTELGLSIPVKLWCQKDLSFTNAMGFNQKYPDAIEDSENNLKRIDEILKLIRD